MQYWNYGHQQQPAVGERLNQLERRNRIPSKDKFRMMPCKTFIMCGGCPYHERCKIYVNNILYTYYY